MAYTTIDLPTDYFNTVLYTGNGSTNAITGVGHQPDFTWIKRRNSAEGHILIDSVRGVDKRLGSNVTSAESTVTYFTSFDTDGFTVNGTNVATNASGGTFCAWNWLAGGTASSNTDGSITSSVSANTTAGFSIVSYTGNGSAGSTIGHGLGQKPDFIIVKARNNASQNWLIYHSDLGAGKYLFMNTNGTVTTNNNVWNGTEPTSSVFSVESNNASNGSGVTYIGYCFVEKKGYSKFGSYTGNGNADGTFVYTGFKPAWIMVKRTDATEVWHILDNKRDPFNKNADWKYLDPASSGAEYDNNQHDFLSNGFKIRAAGANSNASGASHIYMAFAENPFVTSTGIPTCAR
jgi:hypothetical protein